MATIEQAILARIFFHRSNLLVAESGGEVRAWCHFGINPVSEASPSVGEKSAELVEEQPPAEPPEQPPELEGQIRAICFSADGGLDVCEPLLEASEQAILAQGARRIKVGVVRDRGEGYAGLPPVGHGIGVPAVDSRTSSLLSRKGYNRGKSIFRFVVSTSSYRPPVSREALQFRRTTRLEHVLRIPCEPALASSLSHFDIERFSLLDHRSAEILAQMDLWSSDVEAQVMNCDNAILDLSQRKDPERLDSAETFMIGNLIQRLGDRRIYTVETAVDGTQNELVKQLEALQFKNVEQGYLWTKQIR
ncbi:hypothetical protein Q31b_28650 [Novipirellula aureliae]|uniref:Uncharacterized protein n=2 Tax=Novipirellula aureliae TaxID=2527966 RepID=A0A5C6E190_9BACT|nr:hypothetical protein Q31b_28650 [Novipirellula aureliae]